MDKAAAAIETIVLVDSVGDEVRIGDLWQERAVALNWLRHYG